uniref:Sulfotransferase domain-containing protein n=1 Tax=Stomoxys calcitrans TaxID=35570 RepID=A0A1I8P1X2_STOCA
IIYVARNCKDVIVSSYHFVKNLGLWGGENIEDFAHDFMNNEILYTSYWDHVVDFWKMRNEPYIFFTTYEQMQRDLGGVIQKLCSFLERPQLSPEQLEEMVKHLTFESMKSNDQTNLTGTLKETVPGVKEEFQFMRRGIVGSHKDEMTPELCIEIENWSKVQLAQHDLTEKDIFGEL